MSVGSFSPDRPISCAQGRYGEVIVVQGGGKKPIRIDGTTSRLAGLVAPEAAPEISTISPVAYYIARVDVTRPGAVYYSAPTVTFEQASSGFNDLVLLPPGATPPEFRAAKAAAYLNQSGVSEIVVSDGGKGYAAPPNVVLGDSHGKGAVLTPITTGPSVTDPANNPYTGITQWEIVSQPADTSSAAACGGGNEPRFAATNCVGVDLPITGDGTFTVHSTYGYVRTRIGNGAVCCGFCPPPREPDYTRTITYRVTGASGGAGAVLRLVWNGSTWVQSCSGGGETPPWSRWEGATQVEAASPHKIGAGYSDARTVRVEIDSIAGEQATIVIEGYTAGNPANTESRGYSLTGIRIDNAGSGYVVAPQIKITSASGFGAYATCRVAGGRIVEVTLENGGGGYKTPPKIEAVAGGAEAFAVARPHLRGKYQCYYRYIDDTPESAGGPIPSSLSPVREVDAGEGIAGLAWTVPAVAAGGRATSVELWRTTGNQATTLYRVATLAGGLHSDTLTDDELRDPDRAGYAAMPIVLPNGGINANRFTPPPSDKAVVVRFQDRFWYGVDTGGKQPNAVLFSEVDEPESVPDINEIVLQQNTVDADAISALIPFGPTLLIMQARHAYSLSFSKQPVLDAQVVPIAHRGALNQRCWGIHDGVCYVLDQYGIYAISPGGRIEALSEAIEDMFRSRIDFGKRTWPFLTIDPTTNTLRAFVALRGDGSDGFPTAALCYSLASKAWWIETYPSRIQCATQALLTTGDYRCVFGTPGGLYTLDDGHLDMARGAVASVKITNPGSGYTSPPTVTARGGSCAKFQAVLDGDGKIRAIWILSPGYGYTSGSLVISDPEAAGGATAVAEYTATTNSADTPLHPTYRYKTGCAEYPSDAQNPKAASASSRNISLLYAPQRRSCPLSMRLYYNNSPAPRRNVAARNRGVGFSADVVDSAARLDMAANTLKHGEDTGVASAMFAGRTIDDVASADRYVAVELVGARRNTDPVVFYKLDVMGTAE